MDDKHYANIALILALTAFVIATFPVTLPFLEILIEIGYKVTLDGYLKYIFGYLIFFGWIPGLIIAIFAYKMSKRMKGSILLINITRIIAVLAFLGNLGFGIFEIIAILIAPYAPGW
jgi:hypothetical protein